MSKPYALSFDFLAKGLTLPSQILGVPHNAALINFGMNFFFGFISCIAISSIFPMAFFSSTLAAMHIVMMKLCLKDIRAMDILLKKPMGQGGKNEGYLNSYSPCERAKNNAPLIPMKERSQSRFIPYDILFDENTISTKEGSLLQILTLDGVAFSTSDPLEIDIEKELRNRFLSQITNPNIMVHFYLKKRESNTYPKGIFKHDFAKSFNDAYQKNLQEKQFFEHQYYLVLIHKSIKTSLNGVMGRLSGWFEGESDFIRDTKSHVIESLDKLSAQLMALFKSQNIRRLTVKEGKHFKEAEQLSFLGEILNGEQRVQGMPKGEINKTLSYKRHKFAKEKGIVQIKALDNSSKYAAVLSLKEYPSFSQAGLFDALLTEQCELLLSQSFEFQLNKKALKKVNEQRNRMAQSDASETLTDELLITEEELKSGAISLGSHNLSLCVIAKSEQSLNDNINRIEASLNQKSSLIFTRETEGVEAAFWSLLPGNLKYALRESDISSLNFSGFISPHNYPKGQLENNHWGEALLMLETEGKTAYAFNYHVGQVATTLLVGLSGVGKTSVLASTLIASTKYEGWRFVFDRDFGMSSTVLALGGSYSELAVGVKTGMAPLQSKETPESRAFNLLLLKRILSKGQALSAAEDKLIEKVIDNAYGLPKSARTFKNIAPFFGVAMEGSMRERFDRWHSEGQNAWVFDNDADNFEMGSKIYGLDLTRLLGEEFEEVKTPIFMYLFERIGNLIDGAPTAIYIPEGWQVMQDKLFSAQIDAWSRTNRKKNVALIIDTQSLKELSDSEASDGSKGGAAVVREAVTTLFFANDKALEKDYSAFELTDKEFSLIKKALPLKKSEHYFLLRQNNQSVVARVPLHGMTKMLDVVSPDINKTTIAMTISKTKSEPSDFLTTYHEEIKHFKTHYPSDIQGWVNNFKERSCEK